MGKFVLAYTGGAMEQSPEAQQQAMAAWGAWFGQLGDAVVDAGAPFGASESVAAVRWGSPAIRSSRRATLRPRLS